MTLEDAALGRAIREMAETAELTPQGGWVFTITTNGGSWHITARHGNYLPPNTEPTDDEAGPTFLTGAGPSLAEAVRDAREKMQKEVPTSG